jgi:hypothetical protein
MTVVEELRAELANLKAGNAKNKPSVANDGSVRIAVNRARSLKRGEVCVEVTFPGAEGKDTFSAAQMEAYEAIKSARCEPCGTAYFRFSGKTKSWYGLEGRLPKGLSVNV